MQFASKEIALMNAIAIEDPSSAKYASGPELSIISPTFNERENVVELFERLKSCLGNRAWEIIFVDDDSPDRTASVVRAMAQRDNRVRCLQRIGRRGLSSACVEGMLASAAPYIAVIDADLQHDETLLPKMLEILRSGSADIVVGSRYIAGGSLGEWSTSRIWISRLATKLSASVVPVDLTDPMSGFFMLSRKALESSVRNLSAIGFKILLDLFASSSERLRFIEIPYSFRDRFSGESKLDTLVAWEYGMLIADKMLGRYIPVRFLSFSLIGGLGVLVHFIVLTTAFHGAERSFIEAQTAATVVAMTFNFFLNNLLTYRDQRLRGWGWLRGWLTFSVACGIGAVANVGVAAYLFESKLGWIPAAIAGILIGAVWNYAVTNVFTWRKPPPLVGKFLEGNRQDSAPGNSH